MDTTRQSGPTAPAKIDVRFVAPPRTVIWNHLMSFVPRTGDTFRDTEDVVWEVSGIEWIAEARTSEVAVDVLLKRPD
ncbi:hypothetical protein [Saccharothrix texasensis]|nr:hypothetical protein [Saccharothrix texasensis]